MSLNGSITQIKRERDKPYIYMPNPTLIHPKSSKIDHYLKIVDLYIYLKCPENFMVEPTFDNYRPDAYAIYNNSPMCFEVQITKISLNKMKKKIESFVNTYGKYHNATNLVIVSDDVYAGLSIPKGFKIYLMKVPKEPYT